VSELEKLRTQIALGKVHPDRVHPDWAYQRAWNEALAWVEMQIGKIEKGEL
jgi:hypothetical protein